MRLRGEWMAVVVMSLSACTCGGVAGVDGGLTDDAGVIDAGVIDAGVIDAGDIDAGVIDAGIIDAGIIDAGIIDAGIIDAGIIDAGIIDAGIIDAGIIDAGIIDAGIIDAGLFDAGIPDAGLFDAGLFDAGLFDAGIPDAGVPDAGAADAGQRGFGACRTPDAGLEWHLVSCPLCGGNRDHEYYWGWYEHDALTIWRHDAGVMFADGPGFVVLDDNLGLITEGIWGNPTDFGRQILPLRSNGLDVVLWDGGAESALMRVDQLGRPISAPRPVPSFPNGAHAAFMINQLVDMGPSIGGMFLIRPDAGAANYSTAAARLDDDGGAELIFHSSRNEAFWVHFAGDLALVQEWDYPTITTYELALDGTRRFLVPDAGLSTLGVMNGQFVLLDNEQYLVWTPGTTPQEKHLASMDAGIRPQIFYDYPGRPLALGSQGVTRCAIDWIGEGWVCIDEGIGAIDWWDDESWIIVRRSVTPGALFVARVCAPAPVR
jgi:hypothetical protein